MSRSPHNFIDALLGVPRSYAPEVSPDGKWVAWAWQGVDPRIEVYAARTDGYGGPIRLTKSAQLTDVVGWAPDSASVIVSQGDNGDERTQLFRVYLDHPEKMIPLTEAKPKYSLA